MAKFNLFKFLQEVRSETDKVTWPTRRETAVTTAMVFVMVALTAIFFLLADQVMRFVVTLILNIHDWRANFSELNPITVLVIGAGLGLLAFFAWRARERR